MSVQFKFWFWPLSRIIPGSKLSTFDSKAKFELATLKTKQAFEKVLGGLSFEIALLFHTEVMNYEHNCKFLNESTRWLHIYFGCSYLFLKVKDLHFAADDHEVILQLNFLHLNLWVLQRNAKYEKYTERFSNGDEKISPGQMWEK